MSSITEEASLGKLHDPAFKLFGRTIPVSSEGEYESASYQNACQEAPVSEDESSGPDVMRSDGQDQDLKLNPSPSRLPSASVVKEGSHDPTLETEVMVSSSSTYLPNDAPHEKIACEEEALKKPKNLIPCPRCESMDTKFCYFNNYNVNQPRHFCKNCQRYWTAGGNLRNVPIGAGRRKSKPSIPLNQSENIMVREDSPEDAKNLISCSGAPSLGQSTLFSRAHGAADSSSATTTILTFGQENPVLDARKPHVSHGFDGYQGYKQDISSTAHTKTNLNLNVDSARPIDNEKVINTNIYDGQNPDRKITQNPAFWQHPQPFQDSSMEALDTNNVKESNGVESTGGKADAMPTCVSSVSFSYMPEQSRADAVPTCISNASFSHIPGPWAYAPNLAWGNFVPANAVMQGELSNSLGNTNLHQAIQSATQSPWASSADAAHCVTQLPWASLTTHPQALNNIIAQPPPWTGSIGNPCSWPFVQHPLWWNSAWAMPLAAASIAAATDQPLGNNTLRKRQHDSIESDNEKSVPLFMPKTLRIDDPGSAAQSSIWTALGLQTRSDNVASTGMFRKIETKVKNEENNYTLKSNPAAMELSALFRESNLPL